MPKESGEPGKNCSVMENVNAEPPPQLQRRHGVWARWSQGHYTLLWLVVALILARIIFEFI